MLVDEVYNLNETFFNASVTFPDSEKPSTNTESNLPKTGTFDVCLKAVHWTVNDSLLSE